VITGLSKDCKSDAHRKVGALRVSYTLALVTSLLRFAFIIQAALRTGSAVTRKMFVLYLLQVREQVAVWWFGD